MIIKNPQEGIMDFTEKEAKEKEKRRVHVRKNDEDFLQEGVPQGTHGEVVYAALVGKVDVNGKKDEVWGVNVRFYPSGQPPVLIEHIGKDQYNDSLIEEDRG